MVIKKAEEEKPKDVAPVAEVDTSDIPMIPNYLDLILGEVNAIRVMLENQQK